MILLTLLIVLISDNKIAMIQTAGNTWPHTNTNLEGLQLCRCYVATGAYCGTGKTRSITTQQLKHLNGYTPHWNKSKEVAHRNSIPAACGKSYRY